MPKPGTPGGESTQGPKRNRDEMAKGIHSKHQHMKDAVHKILREAGLHGVSVHSIRFKVAHDTLSDPGCDPPCPDGQDCVVDSSGGQVRWVCVPQ
jgi:hypothetical protein